MLRMIISKGIFKIRRKTRRREYDLLLGGYLRKGRTKKRKAPRGRIDRLKDTKPNGEEVVAEKEEDKAEIL